MTNMPEFNRQAEMIPHKVAFLTAGAGGMYCGSCMHDNTLTAAMKQHGLAVDLIPIYTPIRTDEKAVTIDRVFFGGINVYLQQKIPLFRHLPRFLDRFLDSPWLIRRVTSRAIETDARLLGDLTVSMLRGDKGNQRKEVLRLGQFLKDSVQPDVLLLTNVLVGGGIPHWKQQLGVPVVVILQGDDVFLDYLPPDSARAATDSISQIAQYVDRFIVHSRFYGEAMSSRLGIDPQKMAIAPLGINATEFAAVARPDERPHRSIGYLARFAPEKGLQHLVDAFILLKQDPAMDDVRLEIAGWLGEDHRTFADAQFQKLSAAGLDSHYRHHGIIDRDQKIRLLSEIDLLCVPTDFLEPKGLYALEAMATGTPVVLPNHGAFPELIQSSGGGWLVEPRSPSNLAQQLARILNDRDAMRAAGIAPNNLSWNIDRSTRPRARQSNTFATLSRNTSTNSPLKNESSEQAYRMSFPRSLSTAKARSGNPAEINSGNVGSPPSRG